MQITFHPLQQHDLSLLHHWFLQPHLAYWWQEPEEWRSFQTKWSERIATGLSAYHTRWFGHIVCIDAIPIGYIQHFFLTPQQTYGYQLMLTQTAGLDFFIGEAAYLGKKLSVPIIENYLCMIVQQNHPHVSTVLIEPSLTNNRAIHVYAKAGFKSLGQQSTQHGTTMLMYKNL
jgi:RimJ/RimL family protein N-acetyltransferase